MNEYEDSTSETDETIDDRAWIPDSAIEGLAMERDAHPSESDIELTRRQFRESSPAAAASIVHLALYSAVEKVRLDASKYVVERVLGKPGEENPHGRTPLEALLEGVYKPIEEYANGNKSDTEEE